MCICKHSQIECKYAFNIMKIPIPFIVVPKHELVQRGGQDLSKEF